MDASNGSEIGVIVSVGIACVGGIVTLAIKLPRLILDLQKRIERPLAIGTFCLCIFALGVMQGRREQPHLDDPSALNAITLIGVVTYWLLVLCSVIARYVLADREERDRTRSNRAADAGSEDE